MKININKQIFLEALQLIVNISPKTTSEPIINNVLLETIESEGRQYIQVKATNNEIAFQGTFEAEIVNHGKVCVNTSKLFNLVREFRGNQILVDSTPQNWVFLTSENSKIKLPGVDPENFPNIEFKNLDKELRLSASSFKTAIDRTFFAIGENESRRNLMGLNLEIVSQSLIRWTGADAFRISQYVTQLEVPIQAEGNIIIPKKSLLEIKKILDFSEEDIFISFDDNTFQIITPQIKFRTRLIEAEYPSLDRLINNTGLHKLILPKQDITNAVRILSTLTEGDTNSVMKLTIQEGKVLVESQKLEFGEGNDELYCDYSGEELSIGLNIRFLLDSLQAFESSSEESITINITDPETPCVLQCDEWDDFKTVLMPVRIQW